jgi:hypothetical protein
MLAVVFTTTMIMLFAVFAFLLVLVLTHSVLLFYQQASRQKR